MELSSETHSHFFIYFMITIKTVLNIKKISLMTFGFSYISQGQN